VPQSELAHFKTKEPWEQGEPRALCYLAQEPAQFGIAPPSEIRDRSVGPVAPVAPVGRVAPVAGAIATPTELIVETNFQH